MLLRYLLLHVVQSPLSPHQHSQALWWCCVFTDGSIISSPWQCKLDYILCIGSRGARTVSLEGHSSVIQKFVVFCSDRSALRQHGLPFRLG